MASLRIYLESVARRPKVPFWLKPVVSLIGFGNTLRTPLVNLRGGRKLKRLQNSSRLKLHVGCGRKGRFFPDFINCDQTPHKSVDLVTDCGTLRRFETETVDLIYSHAFMEHLYLEQLPVFARECHRILKKDGKLVTLGLPDFRKIAEAYLTEPEFESGRKFDLERAYSLTHGSPETDVLCWIGQLHKTLLDRAFLLDLHQKAGFKEVRMFNYAFKYQHAVLSVGVIASSSPISETTWDLVKEFSTFFLGRDGTKDRILDETIWRA